MIHFHGCSSHQSLPKWDPTALQLSFGPPLSDLSVWTRPVPALLVQHCALLGSIQQHTRAHSSFPAPRGVPEALSPYCALPESQLFILAAIPRCGQALWPSTAMPWDPSRLHELCSSFASRCSISPLLCLNN